MTSTTEFHDYSEMLEHLRETLQAAAGVEGADTIGCFLPIASHGYSRRMGEFSSLSEWLDDVADRLEAFIRDDDEIEGWMV